MDFQVGGWRMVRREAIVQMTWPAAVVAAAAASVHAQWVTAPVAAPGVEQHLFQSEAVGAAI
ncbi:MAG: hypothetical protein ACO38P_07115, partial [Phycisphaerales bacterium]